ncbi:N-acetylmuramoyl-L-alanine amidase [Nocardiopsis tropica]|uniref:peptidoglycan recognition protein family protein n=1 Tax=Nocardiopsis tropica TaxID=109330 RepID=UPI002E86B883|nr:N-acetylmuramoyl-L-alanine amidase [Nocardiopsis tropica]
MPQPDKLQWRSDFGWSKNSPASAANPKSGLVIHYDSSDQNLADKEHKACVAYWKRTRGFHTGPSRGWADIGYSWGCCSHGYVMEGRGLFKVQAAQPGGNSSHYSVTLMTGPKDKVTDAQINAVRQLREWLMEPASSISGKVLGHRDFIATSCPGDRAYKMVKDGTFTKKATWGKDTPSVPKPTQPTPAPAPKPKPPTSKAPSFPGPVLLQPPVKKTKAAEQWQKQMRARGWTITVDGFYGPQSELVCRTFQSEKKLARDGRVGPATWKAAWEEAIT